MARSGLTNWTIVGLLLGIISCSSGAGSEPSDSPVRWIDVLPASYSVADLSVPISFTPIGEDRSGSPVPVEMFDWSSSAPSVVSVETSGGLGMVVGYGAATITARAGGRSGAAILLASPDRWSEKTKIEVVSRADAINAAVLGAGPLAAQGIYSGCSQTGVWTSFPRGTSVTVRVSTTVDAAMRGAINRSLADVREVTGGVLDATFEVTDDDDPIPEQHEVTVTAHPTPSALGCGDEAGCTLHEFEAAGVLHSSRIILPPVQSVNAFLHDAVGHGILGMCHVNGGRIGRAENSLMSNGPFTNSNEISLGLSHLDREVQRAVWGSPLRPGADAKALRSAGLIRP